MKQAKNVDEYIANAPKEVQDRLLTLRKTIKSIAPMAQERISYGIPSYHYKGMLIYFAAWKKHIGLYGLRKPVIDANQSGLKGYVLSKGTIQLPLTENLPINLIIKMVKAQLKMNIAGG